VEAIENLIRRKFVPKLLHLGYLPLL